MKGNHDFRFESHVLTKMFIAKSFKKSYLAIWILQYLSERQLSVRIYDILYSMIKAMANNDDFQINYWQGLVNSYKALISRGLLDNIFVIFAKG